MSRKTTRWDTYRMTAGTHTTSATVRLFSHNAKISLLTSTTVWSNFEIADLDFWRGEAYTKFFEYLDRTGGFYYEVWLLFLTPAHVMLTVDACDSGGATRLSIV